MIHIGGPSYYEESLIPEYHYKKITDDTSGTEATIWAPTSGKQIVINAILVSATTSGTLEIKDQTAGATICVVTFNEKKAVPFGLGFRLLLDKDHALSAKFTVDAGTGDCHITVFGQER